MHYVVDHVVMSLVGPIHELWLNGVDSRSLFHFCQHCRIWDFRRFSISHSHWPIFTIFGELTDANKVMNPQYFGRNPADIQIQIWINPEIWIQIPDQFWFELDAFAEVCAL